MQNNFEKQVQDKMDELRFHPTEPVWQNIEWQIRRKKERRRILFWLPLLLLLAGGGMWWIWSHSGPEVAHRQSGTAGVVVSVNEEANRLPNDHKEQPGGAAAVPPAATGKSPSLSQPGAVTVTAEPEVGAQASVPTRKSLVNTGKKGSSVRRGIAGTPGNRTTKENPPSEGATGNPVQTNTAIPSEPQLPSGSEKVPAAGNQPVRKEARDTASYKIARVKEGDTASEAVVKKKPESKDSKGWTWGATASVGMSGVGKGFSFGSQDIAYDNMVSVPNAGTSGGFNPRNPSPVRKGLSFSVGIEASRPLSSRVSASIGLQYQYYSTTIAVGQLRTQDTSVSGGGRTSVFYLNSGASFQDFRNQYHFVSLPLQVHWQVAKQVPLYLQGGLSLQYLAKSDAVVYDELTRIYYQNGDALNRFQLSGTAGISYGVIRKPGASLFLGPQIQYGLTSFEKHETSNRLFAWGLGARLVFGKN